MIWFYFMKLLKKFNLKKRIRKTFMEIKFKTIWMNWLNNFRFILLWIMHYYIINSEKCCKKPTFLLQQGKRIKNEEKRKITTEGTFVYISRFSKKVCWLRVSVRRACCVEVWGIFFPISQELFMNKGVRLLLCILQLLDRFLYDFFLIFDLIWFDYEVLLNL